MMRTMGVAQKETLVVKKFRELPENQKINLIILFIGIISFLIAANILNAFFLGEDEALFIRLARSVLDYMRRGDFRNFCASLLSHDHPPIPILMVTPFIYFMGYNEAALRMPNILLWAVNCMVATKIGWRLSGLRTGILTGLFLAISGIFDFQGLGFGAAGETLSVLLLINILIDDFEWHLETRRARMMYLWGGVYLAIGYMFFTSTLPVIAFYHLVFLYKLLKANPNKIAFRNYVFYTLPVVGFYLAYNAVFLGIPAYDMYFYGVGPYGQLRQNLGRAGVSHLNIESLGVNLRILNWYVFPFTSWMVLLTGIYYQIRKYSRIFIILGGYGAIWSFYLMGNTGQHFLAYFCWLAPFGIATIDQLILKLKGKIGIILWAVVFMCMFIWTYYAHIKTYTYDNYPRSLVSITWGENLGWINNIYRPMHKIANTLDENLGPNGKFISIIDGALVLYYFPDETKSINSQLVEIQQESTEPCLWMSLDTVKSNKIRAVVSYANQTVCPEIVGEVINYPGSNLKLTLLK